MTIQGMFSTAVFLVVLGASLVGGAELHKPAPMSYVIEPFENTELARFPTSQANPFPRPGISMIEASESLFGNGAIQVQDTISFGYKPTYGFQLTSPYNCFGAQSVSLWVKGTTGRVKLILHDDAHCRIDNLMSSSNETIDCFVNDNLNSLVMFDIDLQDIFADAQPDEWRELSAVFPDYSEFATNRIRGWQIDVVASDDAPVLIDQLACHDETGSLLGNVWHTGVDMATAFQEFTWTQYYHQGQVPFDQISFNDENTMVIDYTAKKVEVWGGFNDWSHIAPANAYYNMSQATALQFSYSITRAASIGPNLAEFRLLLNDGADCTTNCWDRANHERYYSFHDILDEIVEDQPELLPFTFSRDIPDPFQLTTFSGQIANSEFDIQHIKGISLELSIFGSNVDNAVVSGEIELSPLRAVEVIEIIPETEYCTVEENLYFFESANHFYRKIPNQINDCCRLCDEDPDCLFGLTNTIDCFLAGEDFDSSQVGIFGTERETLVYRSFWTKSSAKRGDWCEKCICEGDTIDCRGADLLLLPATYNNPTGPSPRLLDLRENPRLFMIGEGMLDGIPDTLQEIWFPGNLKHISQNSFSRFSGLLGFDSSEEGSGLLLNNAVLDESQKFADVCCGLGDIVEVADRSLTYCNLQYDLPGIDSFLEPFVNYQGASIYQTIRPDSEFLEEAAESPARCAAYCEIVTDCRYFAYDDRNPNALPTCNLLSNRGLPTVHNTTFDDFADAEMTLPGYTSGYPPRTRVLVNNATVLSSPKALQVNPENGYESAIEFSLGSTPLRGAVWVELEVTSDTNLEVTFEPSFFVLYDDSVSVPVKVKVSNVGNMSTSVLFKNTIIACDEAFTLSPVEPLLIEVFVPPPDQVIIKGDDNDRLIIFTCVFAGLALIIFAALVWFIRYQQKNRHNDSIWKVRQEELMFDDPPEVLGRGTFGLVLLAEYRGTQVAVKRAIPPMKRKPTIAAASQFRPQWFDNFGNARDETEFNDQTNTDFGGTSISSNDPGELVEVPAVIIEDQGGSIIPEEAKKKQNAGTVSWGNIDGSASKLMSAKAPVLGSIQEDIPESYKGSFRSKKFNFKMFKSKRDKAMTEEQSWKRMKEDFIEEMRYVSKLRHPCITTVMGAVIDNQEEPMLVMEYMSFGSLYDMLHNETMNFEGDILMSMLRDVAQGIRFLHSSQPIVVHGDLKCANILVDSRLRAKVADFGLSQKGRVSGAVGTPFWMSPELLRGDCVNNASTDIFAIGIIFYEVFSRKDPFEGEDGRTVLRAVADPSVNKRPPIPKSCSVEIRALMEDCWNSDPEKRPSATELDIRLKRIDESKVQTDTFSRSSLRKNTTVSLYDIFPEKIARALSLGQKPEPLHKDCVTIFFADIVNYTELAASMPPKKVADLLDRLYFKFDSLTNLYDVFKVETIGDCYMAVTNLVKEQRDHAKRIAQFAIGVVKAANETYIDPGDESKGVVHVRIGFHSGPVVADVVGTKNPRFCLFGDSVNTASRMESHSSKNRINCSKESADLLVEQFPKLKLLSRGPISVKGKGKISCFYVNEGTRGGRRKDMMNLQGLDESESTIGDDLLSLGGSQNGNVPLVRVIPGDAENPGQAEDVGHDEPEVLSSKDVPFGDQETEKFENEIEKKMQQRYPNPNS